jgi:hypothetical protein
MVTVCGPIGGLQEGYSEGVACGVRKKRERKPYSGLRGGCRVVVGGRFMFS